LSRTAAVTERRQVEELLDLREVAYSVACRTLGRHEGADDAVQLAYLNAVRFLRRGRAPANLRSWFMSVLINAAREQSRGEARRRRREAMLDARTEDDSRPNPETLELLSRSVNALAEDQRLAIALCYEQGFTQREAAEALGVPPGTLSTHVNRGLARLREIMTRSGHTLAPAAVAAGLAQAPKTGAPAGLAAAVESIVRTGVLPAAAAVKAASAGGIAAAIAGLSFFWKLLGGISLAALLGLGTFGALRFGGLPAANPGAPVKTDHTGARISGRVLDHDNKPVPGVKIQLAVQPMRQQTAWKAIVSGDDGSLSGTIPRQGALTLSKIDLGDNGGLFLTDLSGDVELVGTSFELKRDARGCARIEVRLGPPSAVITGTITDEEGKGLAGATVQLGLSAAAFSRNREDLLVRLTGGVFQPVAKGVTDAEGVYRIGVPPGKYSIKSVIPPKGSQAYFEKPPHFRYGVRVRRGDTGRLHAPMRAGGGLELTVLGPDGKPLSGATVRNASVRRESWMRDYEPVGAEGKISIRGQKPGKNVYNFRPPEGSGLAPLRLTLQVGKGRVVTRTVTLHKGAVLRGRVLDRAGKPVTSIQVGVAIAGRFEVDAEGRFEIRGLPTGRVRPYLRAEGDPFPLPFLQFASGTAPLVEVVAGGEFRCDLHVRRLKPATLTGRITDHQGRPVPGVRVSAVDFRDRRPLGDRPSPALTGADGRYRISNLLPGKVTFGIVPPDNRALGVYGSFSNSVQITLREGPANKHDLQLKPATVVRLLLRDEDGRPVPGVKAQAMDMRRDKNGHGGHGNGWQEPSDSNGVVLLRLDRGHKFKPGVKRVLELKPEPGQPLLAPAEIELEPRHGQFLEQVVTVKPGTTLAGRVVDEHGKPVPGAEVAVNTAERFDRWGKRLSYHESSGNRSVISSRIGKFSFANVSPGKYVLGARLTGDDDRLLVSPEPLRLEVTGKGRVDKKLVMRTGGCAAGWVHSHDGRKVRATVGYSQPGQKGRNLDGYRGSTHPKWGRKYRVGPLLPGRYRLHVTFWKKIIKHGSPGQTQDRGQEKLVPEVYVEIKPGRTVERDIKLLKKPRGKREGDGREVF